MKSSHYKSLNEMLIERASIASDKPIYSFKRNTNGQEYESLSCSQLLHNASNLAAKLQQYATIGDRALLIYPPGLEYITAFWSCLLSGVIPIPAYPPLNKDTINKLESIIKNAEPKIILSDNMIISNIKKLSSLNFFANNSLFKIILDKMFKDFSELCLWDYKKFIWLSTSDIDISSDSFTPVNRKLDDIAFLQYTSGSTSNPRGVIVSHGNMLENIAIIKNVVRIDENSTLVSWLPPYHDMGLVTSIIMPVYVDGQTYLMSPITFLRSPITWLEALSKFKSRFSGGPNFAFEYCVNKIDPQNKLDLDLDLSHWQCAFNGGEQVNLDTINRFAKKFGRYGFKKNSFMPSYGLAEATLIVAASQSESSELKFKSLDFNALTNNEIKPSITTGSKPLMSCGVPAQEVKIVDPKKLTLLSANKIGEIWIKGPCVAKGYWQNTQATTATFNATFTTDPDSYLRTGDLGFIDEHGVLYITGRLKDLIIISGKNFYPQDIEQVVMEANPKIRRGCVIAFSVTDNNSESLNLVCETKVNSNPDYQIIQQDIVRSVTKYFGISPDHIVFIEHQKLPKTTSGKLRRQHTKILFLENQLNVVYRWDRNNS